MELDVQRFLIIYLEHVKMVHQQIVLLRLKNEMDGVQTVKILEPFH